MIVKTDDQSKLKKSIENTDKSFTIKTGDHIPIGFALAIYYLENIVFEN